MSLLRDRDAGHAYTDRYIGGFRLLLEEDEGGAIAGGHVAACFARAANVPATGVAGAFGEPRVHFMRTGAWAPC